MGVNKSAGSVFSFFVWGFHWVRVVCVVYCVCVVYYVCVHVHSVVALKY